ncbi:hypothetical protein DPMN_048483 [Dreissena polymorpha]|uniref:Uncharacterized protein n=1 Tax=Dreissena polymorpha TaxID=45954 RepID=A0A9D4I2G4_DREPO|nr:hypothetical protein DPMN_048483 [Dreissena polymorpha]
MSESRTSTLCLKRTCLSYLRHTFNVGCLQQDTSAKEVAHTSPLGRHVNVATNGVGSHSQKCNTFQLGIFFSVQLCCLLTAHLHQC